MLPIVQKGDSVLKKRARDVSEKMFGTSELFQTIKAMKQALEGQEDGVALAAPQVGISLRIFVVAPRVFEFQHEIKNRRKKTLSEIPPKTTDVSNLIYINPTITKLSRKKRLVDEGCLSIRNYYGKVARCEKATIEAYDEHGRKFTRGGADLLAQVFQHEVDHLNGVLFIDKAEDLYYLPPRNESKKV